MDICLHPNTVLALFDEIGRHRALRDDETDIIEAIVCRGHLSGGIRIKWTPNLDRELKAVAITRGGVRTFAAKHGFGENAVRQRIAWIRRKANG